LASEQERRWIKHSAVRATNTRTNGLDDFRVITKLSAGDEEGVADRSDVRCSETRCHYHKRDRIDFDATWQQALCDNAIASSPCGKIKRTIPSNVRIPTTDIELHWLSGEWSPGSI